MARAVYIRGDRALMGAAPFAGLSREEPRLKRSTVGETSPRVQPPRRPRWGRVRPTVGFLAAGFSLQYAVAIVSSFLAHQQGIYPSEYRVAWANWVLERFVHDPRDASMVKAWPQDTSAEDRPDLRVDPFWNPFDPSVWLAQPGFAVEMSGIPVSLVQCFEGGGFLGETWVAFAPIKLRDPAEELPSQHDAPTVETVTEWWMQEWRDPRTRSIHDKDILDLRAHRLRPFGSGPSDEGYLFVIDDNDDIQKFDWVQHLLDTSTLRVTPPRWVELQGLLDRAAAKTEDPMRPFGLLSRAWGFPFRSAIERAELQRRPLRFVEGGVDGWYAPDWEVLSYDGVRVGVSDPFKQSDSSVGVAIQPLWTGAVLNSVIYALVLWWVWRALAALCALPRVLRARRGACRACGHPLAGLARCPECGAIVR